MGQYCSANQTPPGTAEASAEATQRQALLDTWRGRIKDWPPLLTRRWSEVSKSGCGSSKLAARPGDINVLGFNLLADGKQGEEKWECTPPEALVWIFRRWRILEELVSYSPDVLLLQEVDEVHFERFLLVQLSQLGYAGEFKQMPDGRPDGVAVLWASQRFRALRTEAFSLGPSKEVALAVLLEEASGEAGQRLLAASTHLKSGKDEDSETVRATQVEELLGQLQALAADPAYAGEFAPSSPSGQTSSSVPIVLAADMNAEPGPNTQAGPAKALPTALRHSIGLQSAYAEPPYTTWKLRPKGEVCRVIDYILYSHKALNLAGLLDLPSAEEVPAERLPSRAYPSDHFSLGAVFRRC